MSDLERRLAQLTPEQRSSLTAKLLAKGARPVADTVAGSGAIVDNVVAEHTIADNAIAIIGMGCRFPGAANSPEQFWRLLDDGVDAVEPVPAERWDAQRFYNVDPDAAGKSLVQAAGFISDVAEFDAEYFGIAPVEARQMDPQQRLFLEVAMEALDSAGLTRTQLAGSACGVYVGVHSHSVDYYQMQSDRLETVDTYSSTGTAHSVLANRLSYFLDLRGPSMAIDTACSSSLVALHQACLSLRARESDLAVAGGVNLMLLPDFSISITKLRVLSPSGRCRTFDAAADGIARGEGCGVVVVKRAVDAIRDGDPILALIRGSAVNQDGATNGITAPSTLSQMAVIRAALSVAQLDASRVNFVETHGTGTPLGDPIEVEAITSVYGATRAGDDPVVLGALKTNIGHLEGAAGIASVIKTVLCLQHQRIPRNLHFERVNPLLQLDARSIVLPLEPRTWRAVSGTRVGAVSSFGFGGTNAHAILEEAPRRSDGALNSARTDAPHAGATDARAAASPRETFPLVLTARTATALRALVDRWRVALRGTLQDVPLRDLAYTTAVRRTAFAHRVVVTGADAATWAERLDAWARARDHDTLPPLTIGARRKVAFAFCGQGSQWYAMGRELMASEPVFREMVERVARAVSRHVSWDLLAEMARDEATSRVHETEITQPALFAIQMGLVSLWQSWGVEPDFVIAHSSGEIAAACVAGAIDVAEGARIAVLRGRAVSQSEGQGTMVSFPVSATDAAAAIAGMEDRVAIAAMNGPASVVLGGDAASLRTVDAGFKLRGIEGNWLHVRYASHSPQMEGPSAWLRDALGTVDHHAPLLPMYSSISHALVDSAIFDASHWAVGLRRPVDFSGGVGAALNAGCRAFVDIAPHPVMAGHVRECADEVGVEVAAVASLRRALPDRAQLVQSAGELFVAGVDVDWTAILGARGRVVDVLAYPWQHARYWLTEPGARRVASDAPASRPMPVAATTLSELHGVQWVPARAAVPRTGMPKAWAVLGGASEIVAALVERLNARTRCACTIMSDASHTGVAHALQSGADIIDLRALTASLPAELTEVAVVEAVTAVVIDTQLLLTLVASTAVQFAGSTSRVWLVTQGAVFAHELEVPDARQAAVWGVGRVAAMEMPEVLGGLVDVAASASAMQVVDAIIEAVTQQHTEYESAYREGRRLVPRLHTLSVAVSQPALSVDGYYVVTGGLGGVGREVARWLVAHGAKRILLIGRTPLPKPERWSDALFDDTTRERIALVRELESRGAAVCVAVLDVSDADRMRALAQARSAAGWGRARGVLHCATDVQFALIPEITPPAVLAMMRAKIGGAESLLAAFASEALDFGVMFSSMAAWLGERGQGAYAAANTALDAWAIAQRHAGLPIAVINWGAWDATGLAATPGGELVNEGLRQRGVFPVLPADATAALGAIIAHRVAVATVFRSGSVQFSAPEVDAWRLLRDLSDSLGANATATDAAESLANEVRAVVGAPAQRLRLITLVRQVIADTLGLDAQHIDVDSPLGAYGMDSLMAIRIRRRCEQAFELSLPATALFSYPTVSALAGLLWERLGLEADANPPGADVPSLATNDDRETIALSDDQALAVLRTRRTVPRRGSA